MTLDNFLNKNCTIRRAVETGEDRYNNAQTRTVIVDYVRGRKAQKTMRVMDERTGEYALVRADLILLPCGANVRAKDVVEVAGLEWSVKSVLTRQAGNAESHISLLVEAVDG